MKWSDHFACVATLAVLGACGGDPTGSLPDAPPGGNGPHDDGGPDSAGEGPGDAPIDGQVASPDASAPDAACWSCGLPTGPVSSTVTLKQTDCLIHFVTGQEYAISDSIFLVLKGTSPGALTVDVQLHIADALVCTSAVAADGSFRCARNTNYNSATAIGHITGTSFSLDWYWLEDDYWLKCPMMVGTLQ